MKVTMIIGEPCVGKSAVMRHFLRIAPDWQFLQPKYVPHHWSPTQKCVVLGRYDDPGHQFPGTDRMSMAAQPHAIRLIERMKESGNVNSVFFEGDRLGNLKMALAMQALVGDDFEVAHLWVPAYELTTRREKERTQSSTFLKSRRTKIQNLSYELDRRQIRRELYRNSTVYDGERITHHLVLERR